VKRPIAAPPLSRISPARLLGLLLLFVGACAYSVIQSARFQRESRALLVRLAGDALKRPVSFGSLSFSFIPPAVKVENLRIDGAPGETAPFFEAEEISASGDIAFFGRTLSIGSLRARRPRMRITVFPDGSDNLPPGLKATSRRSAVKVKIGGVSVSSGEFYFNEKRVPLDIALHSLVAELAPAGPGGRFRGRVGCQGGSISLPGGVSFPFRMAAGFDLGEGRLHVDALSVSGSFGELKAVGEVPDLSRPVVAALVSGTVVGEKVEEIFHLNLPFRGTAAVTARLSAGGPDKFRISGRAEIPRLSADRFLFEEVGAAVFASPAGVTARIERGAFDGGTVAGLFRIGPFAEKVPRYELLAEGKSISVERFFGNIELPSTGLAAAADVTLALRWRGPSLEKGDGGGELRLAALEGGGPRAVPMSGGGPFSIRGGFIDFEDHRLALPSSEITLNGGFSIGVWDPRMRFAVQSQDWKVLDRLATNFSAAIKKGPAQPFGLEGSGKIDGVLGGRWSLPEVAARLSAENASFAGVRLGTVFADLSVADETFFFHPLRAFDGDARLALVGSARYAPRKGKPSFDLTVDVGRFPIERILKYLALDIPVTGRITGVLPIAGDAATATGAGDLTIEDAVIYGQPVTRLAGHAVLEPGTLRLEKARGQISDRWFAGDASLEFAKKRYRFRLAGDDIPISRVAALSGAAESVSGELSFHAEGEGTLDRPSLTAEVRTKRFVLFGNPVSDEAAPALTVALREGALRLEAGARNRWSLEADGNLAGRSPQVRFSFAVPDLALVPELFPDAPRNLRGEIAASGSVVLDPRDLSPREMEAVFSRLKISAGTEAPPLEETSPVGVRYADGIFSVKEARLAARGGTVTLSAAVDTRRGDALAGRLRLDGDPVMLAGFLLAGSEVSGKLHADLALAGTLSRPRLQGDLELEKGRFRSLASPYVLDDVSATVRFTGPGARLESFHARVGGGDLSLTGDADLAGFGISNFRLLVEAQGVTVRSFEGFRLQTNAELTLVGESSGTVARGEITLLSGTYTKDFAPTLASLFQRSRGAGFGAGVPTWEDRVRLELRIASSASLEVRNNLARLTASIDLLARGTLAQPVLLGQVVFDEGGKITFQDVKYEIQTASITLGNPVRTEPVVDVVATTEVKGYEITVQGAGTLGERSRLHFSFSADPPLTEEQVAQLLLTGSAPEGGGTPGRGQPSTASTVVGSLAGLAFRPVTSRVQQLFRLDKFQIDPVLQAAPGSSGGAVITVGKNISKDLSVTYSYSAETNSQSIILVEYQIDANKVLQASKDENNVYSIDIKFRKRF
jgi:hypothetical protein